MLDNRQPHNSNASGPNLLTVLEVATLLRCSTKTVYRRVHDGKLPATEIGGRLLFDITDIRATLIAKMVRPKTRPSGGVFSPWKASRSNDSAVEETQLNT